MRWKSHVGCGSTKILYRIGRNDGNEEYVTLTLGNSYTGEFQTPTQIDKYQFSASAGNTYIIDTDVDDYVIDMYEYADTVIELYDSTLNELDYDDDDDDDYDPDYDYNESYLRFECNTSGTYIIYVYEYSNWSDGDGEGELGQYDIIITLEEPI